MFLNGKMFAPERHHCSALMEVELLISCTQSDRKVQFDNVKWEHSLSSPRNGKFENTKGKSIFEWKDACTRNPSLQCTDGGLSSHQLLNGNNKVQFGVK